MKTRFLFLFSLALIGMSGVNGGDAPVEKRKVGERVVAGEDVIEPPADNPVPLASISILGEGEVNSDAPTEVPLGEPIYLSAESAVYTTVVWRVISPTERGATMRMFESGKFVTLGTGAKSGTRIHVMQVVSKGDQIKIADAYFVVKGEGPVPPPLDDPDNPPHPPENNLRDKVEKESTALPVDQRKKVAVVFREKGKQATDGSIQSAQLLWQTTMFAVSDVVGLSNFEVWADWRDRVRPLVGERTNVKEYGPLWIAIAEGLEKVSSLRSPTPSANGGGAVMKPGVKSPTKKW